MYRIRIEEIGESVGLKDEMREIECDGFVIIGDRKNNTSVCVHNVSNMDIAVAIAGNSHLMGASIIAKALREAKDLEKEDDPLANLLKGLSLK